MLEITKQAVKPRPPSVVVPVGAQVVESNTMEKSETGWHLNMMVNYQNSFDVQDSKATQFAMPPSKVPGLLGASDAGAPSLDERTLTGTIRSDKSHSCLEVSVAGVEKCYVLSNEVAQLQRIFSACGSGDPCSITGHVDEQAESLGSVSKAEKVSR